MDAASFYQLLENPRLLNADSLPDLEQLIQAYPNSENIKILYALNLLKEKHFRYQDNLTKAAFYASSRRKLKYWVDFILDDDRMSDPLPKNIFEEEEITEEVTIKALDVPPSSDQQETEDEKMDERKIEQDEAEEERKQKQHKKSVRSKAELLALVKKRLAEIETLHQEKLKSKPKDLEMDPKDDQAKLIDQFIKTAPSISRPNKADFFDPQQDAVKSSFDEDDFLVTETLAKIHADQGNLEKATEIYEKLILKFPEKSSYFAALIQDLKK